MYTQGCQPIELLKVKGVKAHYPNTLYVIVYSCIVHTALKYKTRPNQYFVCYKLQKEPFCKTPVLPEKVDFNIILFEVSRFSFFSSVAQLFFIFFINNFSVHIFRFYVRFLLTYSKTASVKSIIILRSKVFLKELYVFLDGVCVFLNWVLYTVLPVKKTALIDGFNYFIK